MKILAIDQGTTSSRAIVYDAQFQPMAVALEEFSQYFPESGWVEHDPEEIWQTTLHCCRQVLAKAHLHFSDISAIGITNQRETTLVWEKRTGKAIYPAIVWQDRRTSEYCRTLKTVVDEPSLHAKTGLLLDPYFSASKCHWILHNVADAKEKSIAGELLFGTIDTYLLWRLTAGKVHATDITNAARTLLFNIKKQCWDEELLELFEIPHCMLPEVKDNAADFGVSDAGLFGVEIPITAMVGDQQAALVGQACLRPGMIKSTYGTGCFMVQNTGNQQIQSQNRLLTTIGYRHQQLAYALEGSIFSAGLIVKWLRDQLGLVARALDTETLAKSVPDTAGVVLVPAFTGLGAPYWDPDARAALYGLSRGTTSAHIVRAGLEAIVYQSKDLLDAMCSDGAGQPTELRVDGGMVANNWLLQFLADMLNVRVVRAKYLETTALGAAYLAAVGLGSMTLVDISDYWTEDVRFEPQCSDIDRKARYALWQEAVQRTLVNHTQEF